MSNTNLEQVKQLAETTAQSTKEKQSELMKKKNELYAQLVEVDQTSFELEELNKANDIKREIDLVERALKNLGAHQDQTLAQLELEEKVAQAIRADDESYKAIEKDKISRFVEEVSERSAKLVKELASRDQKDQQEMSELMTYLAGLKVIDLNRYGMKRNFNYGSVHKIIHDLNDSIREKVKQEMG